MAKIKCLDSHVADLIAAGEVVERPASVVKELVENAIDAGATEVTVEIRRGGMSYIRVTDNGSGIAPEDAETAFLRHATSKIQTEHDLEAIGTLGFRGEALAAISAVSRVELTTRRAEDELGTQLLLDGGALRARQETGCPAGTTMIVRDLFYNTPARLKFMKRDATESAAVFSAVQHIALSRPEVSFRFVREGRQDLLTPGDGQLKSAVYAVLGRDIALGFLPCRSSGEGDLMVEGFVSRPACCRGSRGYQHFFVNGRYVKSRTMTAALEEAYQNQKMVGRFPGCVLHLTSRLNAVDVNVHPAKTEVKFTNEKALFGAIYYAVRTALNGETGHPQMQLGAKPEPQKVAPLPEKPEAAQPAAFRRMTAAEFRKEGETLTLRDSAAAVPPPVRAVPKRFLVPAEEEFRELDLPVLTEKPARPAAFTEALTERQRTEPSPEAEREPVPAPETEQPSALAAAVPDEPPEENASLPAPSEETPEPVQQRILGEDKTPIASETPQWRLAGEVLDTYIIVEQGDTIYFIDKHAAHERMNFDKLKARDYRPMRQLLLTPMVLELPPEEQTVLLAQRELLDEFGFEVEDFGGALLVRQTPDYLDTGEVEETLSQLARQFLLTGGADPSAARDELLHTMACKSAIKGGWKNGEAELRAVAEAVMSGAVKYCPHGRPVAVEMTRKQLEKQFKRT